MLSVSALASAPRPAPAATATFRDRAVEVLLRSGGTLASSRSDRPTGALRWFAETLPSGRVRFEVVEPPPFGSERAAVESAAAWMVRHGYRVLACPERLGRLTICRGRVTQ
jgi:transposase